MAQLHRVTPLIFAIFLGPPCGCGSSKEPDSETRGGETYLACASSNYAAPDEYFKLPPLELVRKDHVLEVRGIKRGTVKVALLGGILYATPKNLAQLRRLLETLKKERVQLIAVAGGVGREKKDVTAILAELSKAPLPILIVPGAQENLDALRGAIDELRTSRPQIIDMTRTRSVRIGKLNIVSLPGYYRPFYLEAKHRGCSYDEDDLSKIGALLDEKATNVLLSPTPPRGGSAAATDVGRGGINMGDPALARFLSGNQVDFGIFGYAYESGGHATAKDGITPAAPGVWSRSLFLQAGAVDATPIALVDGGRSAGMAQIVEFSSDSARFRTVDLSDPEVENVPKAAPPSQ